MDDILKDCFLNEGTKFIREYLEKFSQLEWNKFDLSYIDVDRIIKESSEKLLLSELKSFENMFKEYPDLLKKLVKIPNFLLNDGRKLDIYLDEINEEIPEVENNCSYYFDDVIRSHANLLFEEFPFIKNILYAGINMTKYKEIDDYEDSHLTLTYRIQILKYLWKIKTQFDHQKNLKKQLNLEILFIPGGLGSLKAQTHFEKLKKNNF